MWRKRKHPHYEQFPCQQLFGNHPSIHWHRDGNDSPPIHRHRDRNDYPSIHRDREHHKPSQYGIEFGK